jgi:hypothetical protein
MLRVCALLPLVASTAFARGHHAHGKHPRRVHVKQASVASESDAPPPAASATVAAATVVPLSGDALHPISVLPASISLTPALAVSPPESPTTWVVVEHKRRFDVLGGGLALLVAGYVIDIGASYGLAYPNAHYSLIPLVGPLIQIADQQSLKIVPPSTGIQQFDNQLNSAANQANNSIQTAAYIVFSIDFAVQLAGAISAVVGAATKKSALRYEKQTPPPSSGTLTWQLLPSAKGSALALRF